MNNNYLKKLEKVKEIAAELSKTNVKKLSKAKKLNLGLIDEFDYSYDNLEDEVSRLSYSTDEWFDEKLDAFLEARGVLRDVYINYSENFLDPVDVEDDESALNQIKEQSDILGIDVSEIYPNYEDHLNLIQTLKELDDKFMNQQAELKGYGL